MSKEEREYIEARYYCPVCGRRVVAFDTVVIPIECGCGQQLEPFKVVSYNMSSVRHWDFWDQVDGYSTES